MIGVNTSIFKSAGRKLVNLLGALKDRAAYYENGTDSVAEKNHIDDLGVLDKATILLTPTATSNARVHSVKTYTGDDYLGATWIGGSGWSTITDGISCDGSVSGGNVNNNVEMTDYYGHKFLLTYTLSNVTDSSTLKYKFGGGALVSIEGTDGTHSIVVTNDATVDNFQFVSFTGWAGDITNISLVDVSSDFDFDRASSATRINSSGLVQDMQSITDPELVLNGDFEELGDNVLLGNNSTFDSGVGNWVSYGAGTPSHSADKLEVSVSAAEGGAMIPTNSLFTGGQSGKLLKVRAKLWLGTMTNTAFKAYIGGVQENVTLSSTPTYYDFYLKPTGSGNLIIYKTSIGGSAGTFFIDDVSVQQVDPNDRWSLGTGWSIEDGKLVGDGTNTSFSSAQQNNTTVSGNTYQVTLTVEAVSGAIELKGAGVYTRVDTLGVGTHTLTFVADATYFRFLAHAGATATIDNISVKDITFSEDVDLARINYDSNGENGHWLLEPTSTNLITYSEDFLHSSGYWNTPNTTLETTSIISPDGSNNTYKLFADTGTSSHYLDYDSYTGALSGQTYTFSLFVKSAGSDYIQIASSSGFLPKYQNFNLSTGAKASGDISNSTIEAYPNNWYRISVTETTNSTSRRFLIVPALTDMTRNDSFAGNAQEDGVYIFGAQLEQLSYPTSYIPTLTGSTVTRATETLTGSGNSTLINSTEGVLYFDGRAFTNATDVNKTISLSNQSSSNRVQFSLHGDASRISFYGVSSDGFSLNYSSYSYNKTEPLKVAIKWKTNDVGIFINGTKVYENLTTNTFLSNTLTTLSFADYNSVGSPFYGKVEALAVFNEALEDDELELLTGVTNYGSFGELASANGYTII